MNKIFEKIIDLRFYILLFFGFIAMFGFWSLLNIKIDAIPDITNKQVIINTKTGSMDPTQVEKSVTYLIESELYGIPGLIEMRSLSKFGLSQVTLIFNDSVDVYFVRNLVLQRLSGIGGSLPQGVSPFIAPMTTGIGEILMYRVYNPNDLDFTYKNLSQLRTNQQYHFAREIKKVRGVAEVDTLGGFVRELHFNLNSNRLLQYGMTTDRFINQIMSIGEIFGGGYIERNEKQMIVRTNPNINKYDDIMDIPVKIDYKGSPVPLRNIVDVRQDHSQRLGLSTYNGQETVLGTVMLQSGENAKEVLDRVRDKINEINENSVDAKIEILYDREFLIDSTIKTVMKNLAEGVLLVVGVLFLIIGNLKAGLIVASCLPFCIFILAIFMQLFGVSANLMSLGAIDFGLIVDASVVVIECVVVNMQKYEFRNDKKKAIALIVSSVARPIVFGVVILTLVYVPILLFSGIEGKTFKPMAINVVVCLIASLIVTFLLMPILVYFFINDANHKTNKIVEKCTFAYLKMLDFGFSNSKSLIFACLSFFTISMGVLFKMPSDFLPELNEGDIVFTVSMPESTSLSKTSEVVRLIEKEILLNEFVDKTFSRIGTSEAALDPVPQNIADIYVILKPSYKPVAKKITKEIAFNIAKKYPQYDVFNSQPIAMRFNEMLEGSRADIALKVFGDDLEKLMDISQKISVMLEKNDNVREVGHDLIYSIRKGPVVDVIPNYTQIARHQITIADVNSDVKNSMGGIGVGTLYFSEFPVPVVVHIGEYERNSLDVISNIQVGLADGGSFSLSDVSFIKDSEGIVSIPRSFGRRYSSVSIYLNNTDYANFVSDTKKEIVKNHILPDGYYIEWGGRFNNLVKAKKQIFTAVPIIFLVIIFLLYKMFKKSIEVAIVFSSVPFGICGAVLLLFFCNVSITISVYIGFIALIGISLLNSIILVDTINKIDNIKDGCASRFRPIMMTALVATCGFLPMAFGSGIGSEVQQPIAITVIGGIISSTIATLVLVPVLLKVCLKIKSNPSPC